MIALLHKDWRLNFPATLSLLTIYAILPFLVFFSRAAEEGIRNSWTRDEMNHCLMISALAGLGVSLFIVPAFGGIAFARERRDRSGDFLASHPITRMASVSSKAIVAVTLCLLPWLLSGLFVLVAQGVSVGEVLSTFWSRSDGVNGEGLSWLLRIELMLFGTSWLLSSILRSETIAAGATILGAILLTVAYGLYRNRLERLGFTANAEAAANLAATVVMLTLSIGGFIAGTVIALKRISP